MKLTHTLKLALAFTGFAFGHAPSDSYTIKPKSIMPAIREGWCWDQTTQCPLICGDSTDSINTRANTCDPEQLTYNCICEVNGLAPNMSQYSLTLPYHICTAWTTKCVEDCGANNICAGSCRTDHPCGAASPTSGRGGNKTKHQVEEETVDDDEDGQSMRQAGKHGYTGFAGDEDVESTESAASHLGMHKAIEKSAGMAVLVGGVLLGFGLLL